MNILTRFEITDADGNVALVIKGPWCTMACGSDVEFKASRNILYLHIDKLGSSSALADLLCSDLQLKLEQELLWSLVFTLITL